ncbi:MULTISPECIES: alcohol dehydrogenase catalytic domain-containing protein [unclassified Arthrobacter]|uniref:alcohol dehydrogenase catalytic domain-containing protein n=1 Tax=unclassified Arthrobacter TaxID=235627 RepID=UPI00159EAAE4|nr:MULTISPECIES: alcohol dehydrogenase catalytic domain-containing protein [unclassified Arthrobacter]MCQ9165510.1 alcohol dehydrogenase catalytic domain-containing protein [Arthrobacter sp. STN4]NVM99850.1 alcohol dehydrogenase catalytic domain-containing protein [Arthrobacter sp. SDTb3-6]
MDCAVLHSFGADRPYAASRPLVLERIPVPVPRAGELLVKVERASLCHSDLSVIDGSRPRPLPMALGHEASGTVAAVGPGLSGVEVGERVVTVFVPGCGECRACAAGRPALCHRGAAANGSGDLLHGEALLRSAQGERINHHLGVSAFSSHAVVARESVVVVDPDVPFDIAAMFGCAVLTGMGAVIHTAQVSAGQSVIVFGLGAVGLAAVMGAAQIPGTTVIGIDPLPAKQELALRCGAHFAGAPADAAGLVAQHADDGVDVAIEAVGSARVMESCLALLTRGGALVSVGLPHPDQVLSVQALQFAGTGKRLLGSYMGDANPARDIPAYLRMWREGRLPVELLHTDTRPLAEINEGLDALADGRVVRRLFTPAP